MVAERTRSLAKVARADAMLRFAPLILANLNRRKLRSTFTIAAITVAFLLYGLLAAVKNGFEAGVELAGADRLITIHKVSLVQPLPESYQARIAAVPGVALVTHSTWFGGQFQEPRNVLQMFPVEPEAYLSMYPEYLMPPDQRQNWLRDRTGLLVGRSVAERFGWKAGDRVPIQSDIFARRAPDGSDTYTWEFTVDALYDNRSPSGETSTVLFHYDYFDEARLSGKGTVGYYIERIADPNRASQIAGAIDTLFVNSSAETKTGTEKAFVQSFAQQTGDIGAIVTSIGIAVFFTMLLVSGNTMAQAVRERTKELAVMKTLGFNDGTVLTLVLAESLLLTLIGGALGTLGAMIIVRRTGTVLSAYLSSFVLTGSALVMALLLMLALGLVSGALPALRASRLRIADALARR
jgi:putative ABC transport system permease protein